MNFWGASENDFLASTSELQLAQRASTKICFLGMVTICTTTTENCVHCKVTMKNSVEIFTIVFFGCLYCKHSTLKEGDLYPTLNYCSVCTCKHYRGTIHFLHPRFLSLHVPLCNIIHCMNKALSYLRPSTSAGLVLPFAISVDDLDNLSLVSSMMDELEIFGCDSA